MLIKTHLEVECLLDGFFGNERVLLNQQYMGYMYVDFVHQVLPKLTLITLK